MSKLAKTGKRAGKSLTPFDLFNRSFEHFFNDFPDFNLPRNLMNDWTPSVHVREYKDHFKISTDLPGLSKEDIRIKLDDHMLSVEGERSEEREDEQEVRHHRDERKYGKFYRSFQLPDYIDTDSLKAKFRNGVLDITINKRGEEELRNEPKWIDIEEADTQQISAGSDQQGKKQSGEQDKGKSDKSGNDSNKTDKKDKQSPNPTDLDPQKSGQYEPKSPENAPQKMGSSYQSEPRGDKGHHSGNKQSHRHYSTQDPKTKVENFDPLKNPQKMPNPLNDRERVSPNVPISKDGQNPLNTLEQHLPVNPKDAQDAPPIKEYKASDPQLKESHTSN